MCTPNVWLHPSFGKLLFAIADVLVGVVLYELIRRTGGTRHRAGWSAGVYLLNPLTINVSTRGNSDAIVALLVLAVLLVLHFGK